MESKDVAATSGFFEGTGRTTSGYGTLERTGAHELGHSGRLEHPKTTEGTMYLNLMHQTRLDYAGMKLTKAQILKMKDKFDKKLLNLGRQNFNYKSKNLVGPRKQDGTF